MFTHLISHNPVKSVQMIPGETRQCVCFYLLRSSGGHCDLGGARVQRYETCAGGRREEGALMGFSGELAVKMEERETLRMEPSF